MRRASSCEIGDDCPRAHSPEELKEWKNRFQLQKDKLKYEYVVYIAFSVSLLACLRRLIFSTCNAVLTTVRFLRTIL